jgi:hypothetical protein
MRCASFRPLAAAWQPTCAVAANPRRGSQLAAWQPTRGVAANSRRGSQRRGSQPAVWPAACVAATWLTAIS